MVCEGEADWSPGAKRHDGRTCRMWAKCCSDATKTRALLTGDSVHGLNAGQRHLELPPADLPYCSACHARLTLPHGLHAVLYQQGRDFWEGINCGTKKTARLTCPQLLGQPVQWMRTGRSNSSCSSSFWIRLWALFLVSMMATPQNWAPVQETRPLMSGPGFRENLHMHSRSKACC